MKKYVKAIALVLSLILILSCPVGVSAAEVADATIDTSRKGSFTIFKYDLTNAEKDGVWDSSYVSTGVYDKNGVNDILGSTVRDGDTDNKSDLGNGGTSYGYAIAGVEFSYMKIADIVQFSESTADGRTDNHVEVLYAIDKVKGADFLNALGLCNGAQRYTNEVAVEVQEEIQEKQEEPQSSWQEQYYLGLWLGVISLLVIGFVFAITALVRRLHRRKNRNGGRYLRKKAPSGGTSSLERHLSKECS